MSIEILKTKSKSIKKFGLVIYYTNKYLYFNIHISKTTWMISI